MDASHPQVAQKCTQRSPVVAMEPEPRVAVPAFALDDYVRSAMRVQHEDVGRGFEERGQLVYVACNATAPGVRDENEERLRGLRQACERHGGFAAGLAVAVDDWNNGVGRWGHGLRGRTAWILPEASPARSEAFLTERHP
jgi:hypothetical protein